MIEILNSQFNNLLQVIKTDYSKLNILNSTFENCGFLNSFYSPLHFLNSNISITNSSFTNNSAQKGGSMSFFCEY